MTDATQRIDELGKQFDVGPLKGVWLDADDAFVLDLARLGAGMYKGTTGPDVVLTPETPAGIMRRAATALEYYYSGPNTDSDWCVQMADLIAAQAERLADG